jgi:hypothetical protein
MLVPPGDWREFELAGPVGVKNQGPYGACVGHAAATSLEWVRWIRGQPHAPLNPWFVYAILCQGHDVGASISQALDLMCQTGAPGEASVPWGTIDPRAIPPAAYAEALRFRVEIGAPCHTFDEMMSAAQLREVLNFSVHVGPGFDELDAEGCCGLTIGPGNHAVTAGLGARRSTGGNWLIKCQNSWGEAWGLGGYFWIARQHIEAQSHFDAYTVRGAIEDPSDRSTPVAVRDWPRIDRGLT